jgi:hypothetical protein
MKIKENIESLMQKFDNIRGFIFKGRARNHLPIFNQSWQVVLQISKFWISWDYSFIIPFNGKNMKCE